MEYNSNRKASKASTNSGLSYIPVAVRNEEHTFLSQTSNKGGKKCSFCRSLSHLKPSCPKIVIFGTSLKNDNGHAKDVLISDLYNFNRSVAIRDDTFNRIVMNSIKKLVRGVVTHQIVLEDNRLIDIHVLDT